MRKPPYITSANEMMIAQLKTNSVSVRIVLMSDIDLARPYIGTRGTSCIKCWVGVSNWLVVLRVGCDRGSLPLAEGARGSLLTPNGG